jgi:LysM repeat protein
VNSLKPILIAAVLAGIGYGVYVRINGGSNAPPPGAPQSWDGAPKVELPATAGPAPSWPAPSNSGAAPPANISSAPPLAGNAPLSSAPGGNDAPPYNPAATNPPAQAADPAAPAQSGVAAQANPYTPRPAEPGDVAVQAPAASGAPPSTSAPVYPDNNVPDRYRPQETNPQQSAAGGQGTVSAAVDAARRDLESGQLAAALQKLSAWYDDARLSPMEQQQLNQLLDQVAGTVVYSTQHLLEPPYEVQPNERLEDIAQKYSVPWELLAKINGIDDPASLRPGERLKVVRGPFSAVVSLDKRQLTLLLADGSYAGKFNVGLGRELPPREGVFAVSDKVVNPVYHGPDRAVAGGDQMNPYGQRWIGLGSDLGIHGTDRPENIGRTDLSGSISLNPRDVADVFDILSVGSKVVIRR